MNLSGLKSRLTELFFLQNLYGGIHFRTFTHLESAHVLWIVASFLCLQSQQQWVESFSQLITLTSHSRRLLLFSTWQSVSSRDAEDKDGVVCYTASVWQ